MNSPLQILGETTPESWGSTNGGYRRTLQLHQIIRGAGIELQIIELPSAPLSGLRYFFKGLKFLREGGFAGGCNPRLLHDHGKVAARLVPGLARHMGNKGNKGNKILLWEVTRRENQAVPFLARRLGYSVVALPHNLETLVPSVPPRPLEMIGRHFEEEARAMRAANAVFTTSREEQWLLALYGLSPIYLPYFPPEKIANKFLAIRARRRAAEGKRFLILGTVWNPPTLAGVVELIQILRDLPGGASLPVDIAGFGTEQLQNVVNGTNFRLHGSVDEAKLEELLLTARAVLVHQRAATGALTRITEMLLAGVPVFANGVGARSHIHLDGLEVYDTPAQLCELLKRPPIEPKVPERPVQQEQRLVEVLRQLGAEAALRMGTSFRP
ncbi:MAG: hypothetical protein JWR19_3540 [Pedosphaera sp.]|nr:hypothetical protein [Pedosphaera sp.]